MKTRTLSFVVGFILPCMAVQVRAEERKYTVPDLQALEVSQSWDELYTHILDVPPPERKGPWNRVVESACTRGESFDSYPARTCFEALKAVMAAEPENTALAWKAGKWARLNLAHWSSLLFFSKAGIKPGDARCSDEDVTLAIVSGLGQTDAEPVNMSQELAFKTCWPAQKTIVLKNLAKGSYFAENACRGLRDKGALSGEDVEKCIAVN